MIVKLDSPGVLSKSVDIISELVTEVRLKVNEFGMSITAMDPANVSMVGFKIPKSAFSKFEAGNEVLGINLDSLKKILKRCGSGSSLILEKKDNFLDIQIQDRINRNFSLGLIEIESEDIDFAEKVSRMEFSSKVEIASNDLIDVVEDCLVVADACSFKIENEKFIIHAKGMNSTRAEFSDEGKIEGEDCSAKYSLEYLQKFLKASKLSEKTKLNFAQDHPLKLDVQTSSVALSFILAPRVESEE